MNVRTFGTLVLAGGAVAVVVWLLNKVGRALTAVLEALATLAMVLVTVWLLVNAVYLAFKAAVTHWRTTLGVTVVGAWGWFPGFADRCSCGGRLGGVAVAAPDLVGGLGGLVAAVVVASAG